MRRWLHAVVLVFCVFGTLASGVARQSSPAPRREPASGVHRPTYRSFAGIQSWSQYVKMRDGVRLAVDVHLPRGLADGERTATILHMSRYWRSVDIRGVWKPLVGFGLYALTERDIREAFVKAGYSWIDVDVRGAGASFGRQEYPLSVEEVRDGADLIDWIVAQPWSAGVVGATGSSYDGTLASLLVRNGHPALKAIAPRFSGWDVYSDIFLPGGLQAKSLLHDWAKLTSALDRGRLSDVFGWKGSVVARGVQPVDPSLLPMALAEHARNVDILRLLGGVVYRDDTDPRGSLVTMDHFSPHAIGDAAAGVPVYSYAGWFDAALPRGQIRQYLANTHTGSRLRLGPWFHAGEFNASPHADGRNDTFDHASEMIKFFDYHLRQIDSDFTRQPPVQYYTMGEERWKSSNTWPPPGAVWRSFFLDSQGALSAQPATNQSAYDRYEVDPATTSGPGARWGLIVGTGARRGYKDRRNGMGRRQLYTSLPLQHDLEVTGHPIVRMFLKSSSEDAAVFAYLEEVRPSGEVRYVTEGQLRLLHNQAGASPIPGDPTLFRSFFRADGRRLVPHNLVEVAFDLLPTSFVFRAGHAIRLAITGADAESFVAPSTALPLVYEIHRSQQFPSRLELPTYK